jgi:hypothetical protein
MNKQLVKLAIHLLDTQDGVPTETYDHLKQCLIQEGDWACREITDNVISAQGRYFLDEDWIEENAEKFE